MQIQEQYKQESGSSVAHKVVLRTVINTRLVTKSLLQKLESLTKPQSEIELFMMKKFLALNFEGVRRRLVEKFVISIPKSHANVGIFRTTNDFIFGYAGFLLLVAYLGGMVYVILYLSVWIESRSTMLWLSVGLLSVAEEFLFLQQLLIWLKWVCLVDYFNKDLVAVCN